MHRIQQFILNNLMKNHSLRYAQLKPSDVEGNLFMYHLHRLMRDRLITKRSNKYVLTAIGSQYIERLSLKTAQPRIQPKIVTMIAYQNSKKEWLVYRRKHQPFLGLIGFPYGKIHLGEKIKQAATRELMEKTGLKTKLVHRGDLYSTVYEDGELLSQILCHVFYGKSPTGELRAESEYGSCFWMDVEDLKSPNYMPAFADIIRLLRRHKNRRFFAELVYHI
jgi:ADP-ribose pyrophosphatase YjhB (NUDIX family)